MTSRRKKRASSKKKDSSLESEGSSSAVHPEEEALLQVFTQPLEDLYQDRIILPPIPPGQEIVQVIPSQRANKENDFKRNNTILLSRLSREANRCPLLSRWLANFFFGTQFVSKRGKNPGPSDEEKEPQTLLDVWNRSLLKAKKPGLNQRKVKSNPLNLVMSFPMACYPNGDLKEPLFRRMMNPGWEEQEERIYPHIDPRKLKMVTFRDRNINWEWVLVVPDEVVTGPEEALLHPTLEPILGFLAEHNEVLYQGFVITWNKFEHEAKDVCPCMTDVNVKPPFLLTEQLPPVVGTEAVHTFLSSFALASSLVAQSNMEMFSFMR